MEETTWFKSSYSGTGNECVSVKFGATVGIRDDKDIDGDHLTFGSEAYTAFIESLKPRE